MREPVLHAFRDDALGDVDGVELARRIHEREVSPVEVLDAVIERAGIVEPLAAIVCESFEAAMTEARAHVPGASAGAFAGVPTFIKDQIDVAGLPTRYGSDAHRGERLATRDDPVARQLFDMGLICAGKSTLPEYGFVPSTEFPAGAPTRNPWNPARQPAAPRVVPRSWWHRGSCRWPTRPTVVGRSAYRRRAVVSSASSRAVAGSRTRACTSPSWGW